MSKAGQVAREERLVKDAKTSGHKETKTSGHKGAGGGDDKSLHHHHSRSGSSKTQVSRTGKVWM